MNRNGYIAIMTTLILSLVMLVIALITGSNALLSRFDSSDSVNKKSSHFAAYSCLEYARLRLAENSSYGGNATTTIGSYQCYLLPIETSGSNKIIKSRAALFGKKSAS